MQLPVPQSAVSSSLPTPAEPDAAGRERAEERAIDAAAVSEAWSLQQQLASLAATVAMLERSPAVVPDVCDDEGCLFWATDPLYCGGRVAAGKALCRVTDAETLGAQDPPLQLLAREGSTGFPPPPAPPEDVAPLEAPVRPMRGSRQWTGSPQPLPGKWAAAELAIPPKRLFDRPPARRKARRGSRQAVGRAAGRRATAAADRKREGVVVDAIVRKLRDSERTSVRHSRHETGRPRDFDTMKKGDGLGKDYQFESLRTTESDQAYADTYGVHPLPLSKEQQEKRQAAWEATARAADRPGSSTGTGPSPTHRASSLPPAPPPAMSPLLTAPPGPHTPPGATGGCGGLRTAAGAKAQLGAARLAPEYTTSVDCVSRLQRLGDLAAPALLCCDGGVARSAVRRRGSEEPSRHSTGEGTSHHGDGGIASPMINLTVGGASPPLHSFAKGMQVRHPSHGIGEVIGLADDEGTLKVQVLYPTVGKTHGYKARSLHKLTPLAAPATVSPATLTPASPQVAGSAKSNSHSPSTQEGRSGTIPSRVCDIGAPTCGLASSTHLQPPTMYA